MVSYSRRKSLGSLAAFALVAAAFATPASAATDTWRHGSGRWHGATNAGSAYGHAHYQRWPYRPGQDRVDEGPGFYQGYGSNSRNVCYPGESMYDGC
jgi:hypothetical protein